MARKRVSRQTTQTCKDTEIWKSLEYLSHFQSSTFQGIKRGADFKVKQGTTQNITNTKQMSLKNGDFHKQQSTTFLAPGISFMKEKFSMD